MKARKDFWSMLGDFHCRQHVTPRERLCVPTESSFPMLFKNIDVVKETKTNLDNVEGSIIYDLWNIDEHKNSLSELERIHEIPSLQHTEIPSLQHTSTQGYSWVDDKTPVTSRPEAIWREMWSSMSTRSQKKAALGYGETPNTSCTTEDETSLFSSRRS